MSARDPTPMLQAATEAYKDSRQIGIIGPPRCGKTVVAGLLYDAIVNKFLPDNPNYRLQVENGLDFLQKTMLALKKGEFPVKTPAEEINKVEMVLSQELATGRGIEIKLHDVVGEVYKDLYIQEVDTNERLYRTLERGRGKKPFGDTGFLIYCKLYVILVDCAEFQNWAQISYDNVKLVTAIRQWKEGIKGVTGGKIKTPIAVMFAKIDLLDEENRKKAGEDLMKEYMREFYEQLKATTDAPLDFFNTYLEIERDSPNKPALTEDGNFKVKNPIKYSQDEYVKFISWVDRSMK